MRTSAMAVRAIRILALFAVAIVIGVAATTGAALLGHEFLVVKVGEEGIPAIDDTPLMFAVVGGSYLAGGLSGLAVLVYSWSRFLRRRS